MPFTNVDASFIGEGLARQHTILALQRQLLLKMCDVKDQVRELKKDLKDIQDALQMEPSQAHRLPKSTSKCKALVLGVVGSFNVKNVLKSIRKSCGPPRNGRIKRALAQVLRAKFWK